MVSDNWSNQSLADLVELGKEQLKNTSDSAKLDAQILLAFVIDKPTTHLHTWPEKIPSDSQALTYRTLILEREAGKPVAYLVGEKEFWSLSFEVSPSTLILRPDTEILVEEVLGLIESKAFESPTLLDLGTGTGAIALSLASELPTWSITAVDFNQKAVELATRNAKKHGLASTKILHSNWFSAIGSDEQFDVIVSNPPYIDSADVHLEQGDVRFEPSSALVANDRGYADLKHIANDARNYFKNIGYLFLEHGFEQGEEVRNILSELGYKDAKTVKDFSGNDRITWAYYCH